MVGCVPLPDAHPRFAAVVIRVHETAFAVVYDAAAAGALHHQISPVVEMATRNVPDGDGNGYTARADVNDVPTVCNAHCDSNVSSEFGTIPFSCAHCRGEKSSGTVDSWIPPAKSETVIFFIAEPTGSKM
jgi:hypothetical protein